MVFAPSKRDLVMTDLLRAAMRMQSRVSSYLPGTRMQLDDFLWLKRRLREQLASDSGVCLCRLWPGQVTRPSTQRVA